MERYSEEREGGHVAERVEGAVIAITEQGNLVTDIAPDQLARAPRDPSVTIRCDEHMTIGIYPADHSEPAMTLLAVLADGTPLELTLVGENASAFLGLSVGARVSVEW